LNMNVQTFNGYSDGGRTSSKVLRPPGGGASDIFGLSDPAPAPAKPAGGEAAAPTEAAPAVEAPAAEAPPAAAPAPSMEASAPAEAPQAAAVEPAAATPAAEPAAAASAPEPAAAAPAAEPAATPEMPPIGADEIGGTTGIAGSGNQDRTRIDANGRIMSAPAFKANRVPPGGHSSGPLW